MTTPDEEAVSDAALLAEVRAGEGGAEAAFEELYARHHAAAITLARRCAGADLAPEIAAEAFVRILALLRRGQGPHTTFRAYLAATINSVWVDHVRRDARHVWSGDEDDFAPLLTMSDGSADRAEAQVVASAFGALPPRWQQVLWLTSVEQVDHEEVGRLMGLAPNAVAALAKRARDGLREAYLTEHVGVSALSVDAECAEIAPLLAGYVRGTVRLRKRRRVESHLELCAPCRVAADDLDAMASRLGALLLPAVIVVIARGGRDLGGVLVGDPAVPHAALGLLGGAAKAAGVLVGAGAAGSGGSGAGGGGAGGGGGAAAVLTNPLVIAGVAGSVLVGAAAVAAGVALGGGGGDRVPEAVVVSPVEEDEPAPAEASPPQPAVPDPSEGAAPERPPAAPRATTPAPDPRSTPAPRPSGPRPAPSPTPAPSPAPSPGPSPTPTPSPTPEPPTTEPPVSSPRIDDDAITVVDSPERDGWSRVRIPLLDAEGLVVSVGSAWVWEICVVGGECYDTLFDGPFEIPATDAPLELDVRIVDLWPEGLSPRLDLEIFDPDTDEVKDSAAYDLPT